ncbi:hypothetical protein QE412_003411 [Microbacterium trichothecenolyticum]|uniref:Uncharacterized protein n=1 Tax=Microbacterium trichothecenolyticum TaxID=69370 RepID=A0ABU0TYV9_MICTR|nr:hypothetical protein [Microbacterium trichothecenolyticum]
MIAWGGQPLGAGAAGLLAEGVGVVPALLVAAVVSLATAVIAALLPVGRSAPLASLAQRRERMWFGAAHCGASRCARTLGRHPGRGHHVATAMRTTDAAIAPICPRSSRAGIRPITPTDSTA